MDGYITENRLLRAGPPALFPINVFSSPMSLREIHRTVRNDAARAVGKFCRPSMIIGKEGHAIKYITIGDSDFIAEILPTFDVNLLKWEENHTRKSEQVRPFWRIRAVRDPDAKARNLKDLCIYGPSYVRGLVGSAGPGLALSPRKGDLARSNINRTPEKSAEAQEVESKLG